MNKIRKTQVVSQRKVMISKWNSEKIQWNKEINWKHTTGLRISPVSKICSECWGTQSQ